MSVDYLMYSASILYFCCYIPDLYANYKNKNANVYNIPEKFIFLIATSCAFSYSIIIKNDALIINYGPALLLDVIALYIRIYYTYMNKLHSIEPGVILSINQSSGIHLSEAGYDSNVHRYNIVSQEKKTGPESVVEVGLVSFLENKSNDIECIINILTDT